MVETSMPKLGAVITRLEEGASDIRKVRQLAIGARSDLGTAASKLASFEQGLARPGLLGGLFGKSADERESQLSVVEDVRRKLREVEDILGDVDRMCRELGG